MLRRGQKGWFAIAGTGSVEPALVAFDFAKVIIAASRLFGQEVCALRKSAFARLSGHGITHLDFAGQSRMPRNPCVVSLDSSGCTAAGFGEGTPQQVRPASVLRFQILKLWPQVDTCLSLFSKLFLSGFQKAPRLFLIYQLFAAKRLPCLAKYGIHVIRKFDASRSTEGRPRHDRRHLRPLLLGQPARGLH